MYGNPLLIKTFLSGAAINPYRIVKFGADDGHVIQGAAATDALLGIANELPTSAAEQNVDVVLAGIAELELGTGGATRGGPLTSDSVGKGVAAAPAAGANNRIIGFALKSGAAGDIVPVLLALGSAQG